MSDEGGRGGRGGFGRGGRGDRDREGGRGRGRGEGRGGRGRGGPDKEEWVPVTKLGRLVKAGKIKSLEEVFLFSMPVKEYQIIDHFLKPEDVLKDEVMSIKPVQKQTRAGQRTRFKAYVAVGDFDGHVGLGWKCAAEVATAIRGAIISAKLNIVPLRRGYWGSNEGKPHTVPTKISAKCGSVRVRLIPAPRGTGLVAAPVAKKLLMMAGLKDVYSSSSGHTRSLGNFSKAVFFAMSKTYGYLTPNLWEKNSGGNLLARGTLAFENSPFQDHTDFLAKAGGEKSYASRDDEESARY